MAILPRQSQNVHGSFQLNLVLVISQPAYRPCNMAGLAQVPMQIDVTDTTVSSWQKHSKNAYTLHSLAKLRRHPIVCPCTYVVTCIQPVCFRDTKQYVRTYFLSTSQMLQVVAKARAEKDNGSFLQYDGQILDW